MVDMGFQAFRILISCTREFRTQGVSNPKLDYNSRSNPQF